MQNASRPLLSPRPPIGEEERIAAIFASVEQHIGFVPDGLRLYSLSPPLLESFMSNIGYFNSGERISPALMVVIRYLVSSDAKCQFCIDLNEAFMANMGVDIDRARAARDNLEDAPVEEKEKPLLAIALKSVKDPESVTESDIMAARKQGWGDREIFDVVAQAASNRAFNYVLRTFNIEHQGALA
jgi:alkylhydroperoxidase family enzyme